MGFIAKILSTARDRFLSVKSDTGGGVNLTGPILGPPGDDSTPLPGDRAILVPVQGSGAIVCVGTADTKNQGETAPGEKRIYSRNSAGEIVAAVHMKADGSIGISAAGEIDLNGIKISATGSITFPPTASVTAGTNGVNLATHIHATPSGPSGPPQEVTP